MQKPIHKKVDFDPTLYNTIIMRHTFLTLGFTIAMMISSSNAVQEGIQMVNPDLYYLDDKTNPLRDSGVSYDSLFSAKAYTKDVNGNAAIQRRSFLPRRKQGHAVHQRRSKENVGEEDKKEDGDETEEEEGKDNGEESDDF